MSIEPQITIFVDPKGLDEINAGGFPSNYGYFKATGGDHCYIPIQLSVSDFQNRKDKFNEARQPIIEKRLLTD